MFLEMEYRNVFKGGGCGEGMGGGTGTNNARETSKLIQYILIDDSQIITNSRNKVLEVSKDGINYFPLKSLLN